jgi:hypothetical protein
MTPGAGSHEQCLQPETSLTLRLWFCVVTPERMRNVRCSVWSSRSCCLTITGTSFQYSVFALDGSNPLAVLSSSIISGMAVLLMAKEHALRSDDTPALLVKDANFHTTQYERC